MSQNTGLRGQLLRDEPMSRHTSWRVGGPARCFYRPADSDDLAGFLNTEEARDPLLWLGLGSNLLVRDGGFSGTVIATKGRLDQIEVLAGNRISVGAGASCAKVARETARAGLCGAAFLAGIPGTMGGALAMNAGAFGGETWERVDKVNMVNRQGEILERAPEDFEISYRHVAGPRDEWFLSCEMQLEPGDIEQEQAAIRQLLDQRNRTQPTGMPSAGSTFRNPPGDYAARLIEAAGLKGFAIGGAWVSEKHANFIITDKNARAADVEAVMDHVKKEVEKQFTIELVPEVHVVGEAA